MKDLKSAFILFFFLTIVLGGIYPGAITLAAYLFFPHQAKGSLITDDSGRVVGSALLGQPFTDQKYFWPRPSATLGFPYNPLSSAGSNLGPTNPQLIRRTTEDLARLRETGIKEKIPTDLLSASASGLDPHISPEAAWLQIPRVARTRGMTLNQVQDLVKAATLGPQAGVLGAPRVSVLTLNMALDTM